MKKGKFLNGMLSGMIIGSAVAFPREIVRGAVDFYSDAVNGIKYVREMGADGGLEDVVGIERVAERVVKEARNGKPRIKMDSGLDSAVIEDVNVIEDAVNIIPNKDYREKDNEEMKNIKEEDLKSDYTYEGLAVDYEKRTMNYHAKRIDVEPELLMAVRKAENGGSGVEFGILAGGTRYENDKGYNDPNGVFHSYDSEFEKQCAWAAHTIKSKRQKFDTLPSDKKSRFVDFIDFMGDKYCPVGAENDPSGLNKNWKQNVRSFYDKLKND